MALDSASENEDDIQYTLAQGEDADFVDEDDDLEDEDTDEEEDDDDDDDIGNPTGVTTVSDPDSLRKRTIPESSGSDSM